MMFRLKWRLIEIMILVAIDDDTGTTSELKSNENEPEKSAIRSFSLMQLFNVEYL